MYYNYLQLFFGLAMRPTYSFRNHVHCWHLKEIRVLVDELNSTERRIEK